MSQCPILYVGREREFSGEGDGVIPDAASPHICQLKVERGIKGCRNESFPGDWLPLWAEATVVGADVTQALVAVSGGKLCHLPTLLKLHLPDAVATLVAFSVFLFFLIPYHNTLKPRLLSPYCNIGPLWWLFISLLKSCSEQRANVVISFFSFSTKWLAREQMLVVQFPPSAACRLHSSKESWISPNLGCPTCVPP